MRIAGWYLTLSVLILVPSSVLPQAVATGRIAEDVRYLSSDSLQGRRIGSAGADSAAAWIALRMEKAGLTRVPGSDSWYQSFVIAHDAAAAHGTGLGGVRGRNVIGLLRGKDPALAGHYVVVGAHYDHLGNGGSGSLDPDSVGVPHNGADDNASGVAAILEIARKLAANRPSRSVIFVAFSGEEEGLLGSAHFVKFPPVPTDSMVAMLNFDMVGRLRDDKLIIYGVETAREWRGLIDSLNRAGKFSLTLQGDGYGPSDHTSFTLAKRPVLHFFTGTHPDYHRTTDDVAAINLDGILRVASMASDLARQIGGRGTTLTFVESVLPMASEGASRTSGYGAYLGSIPDMSTSPGGVALSGVRSGSPAQAGGLKAGDVITRIGTHAVPDLQAMTVALRAYAPGDTVEIVYRREGSERRTQVVLGRRGG
ncbi:MAG TPA: M20/M25/M40 family metallo-hydrolase [Gemmatimonadales bacterium]|nr:M20/M25/M40 family metallo-hydrolase [Gemmatimonadales bacterium]